MASSLSGPMIMYFMCARFISYACSLYRVAKDLRRPDAAHVLLSVSCGVFFFFVLVFFDMEA